MMMHSCMQACMLVAGYHVTTVSLRLVSLKVSGLGCVLAEGFDDEGDQDGDGDSSGIKNNFKAAEEEK